MRLLALKATLRHGPYAWPGGYPMFCVTSDGEALCFACVRKNWRDVVQAHIIPGWRRNGWYIAGADINWEDTELTCDCCNARIESAYGLHSDTEEAKECQ